MTAVIEVHNLSKRYKEKRALDNVSLAIEGGAIYGLLGRNGAGKTTLMSILTAQNFESSGTVKVFGEHPYENAHVLSRICFVRESQKYPDDAHPKHAFKAASLFFPNWDQALADELIAIEKGLYAAAAITPESVWRTVVVAERQQETPRTVAFVLADPSGAPLPDFLPGQKARQD